MVSATNAEKSCSSFFLSVRDKLVLRPYLRLHLAAEVLDDSISRSPKLTDTTTDLKIVEPGATGLAQRIIANPSFSVV